MYAIIRSGDKQFRAEAGRTVRVPTLQAQPGESKESGQDRAITLSYKLLGLISFLTAGEDECPASP